MDNKKLNYNRDDVYIISLNNSSDEIENTKVKCYNNPKSTYEYFARVDACFDKSWRYMKNPDKIKKKLDIIRKDLYGKRLLNDLNDDTKEKRTQEYLFKLLEQLTDIYREMTSNYIETGLFPKFYLESDEVGAVKQGRLN